MSPLKILIANNTLSLLAGSETWTRTLAFQLKKMGHIVEGFSPDLGIVAKQLEDRGIPCYKDMAASGVKPFSFVLQPARRYDYDVIIANHNHIVDFLRHQFKNTPIISTIHGIIHYDRLPGGKEIIAPERPALDARVNQFVAVSEEVQEKLKQDYQIDAMLVRNFIDPEEFKISRRPNKTPKVFLVNTNYATRQDHEVQVIKAVANHYGGRVIAVGQNFAMNPEMAKAIQDADVVVGMGRSVLEGVAAGRLGFVHGRWGTGGIILPHTVNELRACNFSGRNSNGEVWSKEKIIEEIDAYYNKENLKWGMEYVQREHNVVFAAEVYVQAARMLLGTESEADPSGVRVLPYRRARDVQPA